MFAAYLWQSCVKLGTSMEWHETARALGGIAVLGKTVEDAEEELGFPRGYTALNQPDIEPYRWQVLRQQADGCLIEAQFERWLQKYLPRPEPLPPYEHQTSTKTPKCP